MPHQSGSEFTFILNFGKFGGFLFARCSDSRVNANTVYDTPEVSDRTVVMQIFGTYRLKQKAVLIHFGISAKVWRNSAFQSCF